MSLAQDFVETKLATKFSDFIIRVYEDSYGKETVVLRTKELDVTLPVLVRVHSECLTGDIFCSLHCDCGQQLHKSLALISKEGGVLIYLRQEGRGIGLFEKMKTYQLQSQGIDTFEANVLLGHQPDERSYEMVKIILDDLGISRIRLLTNNPSKISEISKFGIEVVERVPVISKTNKHNKNYIETKKSKFQHLFNQERPYFYQFNVDKSEHLPSILAFVKQKKKDPLLKIGVGISANHFSLHDPLEIERIRQILISCEHNSNCIPSLHFSCTKSPDILKDLSQIHSNWPAVKRLQINDLEEIEVPLLKKLSETFQLDIPLSDKTFPIVHNQKFRHLAKKHNWFILLDNSKGRGVKESKENFSHKIDTLLSYGLNNIFLCGGFGPDCLGTYFELRRHYKINFSIDAESSLKTNGHIDPEKVKIYLFQLFRFDHPKQEGINQTKKFLMAHRRLTWEKAIIDGHEFLIHPEVFPSGRFPSTGWFAKELYGFLKADSTFCEIGCGAGAISCLVALSNPELQIVATDINPHAKENTKANAEILGLSSRISAFTGDVLDSIKPEKSFDSIFWALPFGFLDPGTSISLEDAQVFDPGYRAIRKLLTTAKQYLSPKGKLFLGFSSDLGNYNLLENLAEEAGASIKVIAKTVIQEDVKLQFEILEVSYEQR